MKNGIWMRSLSRFERRNIGCDVPFDAGGDVFDVLVQTRRNAKAAKRFLQRLINQFGEPRVVITDKLRSYVKPIKALAPDADHRAHKGLNNAIEGSHRPTQKREDIRPVQVTSAGSVVSIRSRSDQPNFPSPPISTHRKLISPRPSWRVQPLGRIHHRDGGVIYRPATPYDTRQTTWQCPPARSGRPENATQTSATRNANRSRNKAWGTSPRPKTRCK